MTNNGNHPGFYPFQAPYRSKSEKMELRLKTGLKLAGSFSVTKVKKTEAVTGSHSPARLCSIRFLFKFGENS